MKPPMVWNKLYPELFCPKAACMSSEVEKKGFHVFMLRNKLKTFSLERLLSLPFIS